MSAVLTFKSSGDFQRLARTGRRASYPAFILQILKTDSNAPFRVGFTASRKVGNAVMRNRAKRRLREMVRLFMKTSAPMGYEVVLIAKTEATALDFQTMQKHFKESLSAAGCAV